MMEKVRTVSVEARKLNSWLLKNKKMMEQLSATQVSGWLESNCDPQCMDGNDDFFG